MSVEEFAEQLIKYYNALNKTYGPLVAFHIQEKLKEIKENEKKSQLPDQAGGHGDVPR